MKQPGICRAFAHACSIAVVVDAAVPRPGLSSFTRPRVDLDPLGLAALAPIAYEACMCSCREGLAAAHGVGGHWCRCWAKAVKLMSRWGNPGLGSLLLLSLQAASLGYSYEKYSGISLHHVMGSSRLLLELCGENGARYFYDSLRLIEPSYLGRLSWSGLPDATQRQNHMRGLEFASLVDRAALYDNVLRDAARFMDTSLGLALNVLRETPCLGKGVEKATYLLASLTPDFLLRRKTGKGYEDLWLRAYHGESEALKHLYEELGGAGPGSIADIVVNAIARRVFESIVLGESITLLC